MHNYLQKIVDNKQREIDRLLENPSLELVQQLNEPKSRVTTKSFKNALAQPQLSVIAEVKRKSPSKSHLAIIQDPAELASTYAHGGASAVSVLTDSFGFNGSLKDLSAVSKALSDTPVAVLRKDFIFHPIQVAEAVLSGADAVLLITCLLKNRLSEMLDCVAKHGLNALVEVENREDIEYAVAAGAEIIGVNNRDLTTFEIDTQKSMVLYPYLPEQAIKVAESGILEPSLVHEYQRCGFDAVLVGEALVKAENPAALIQSFREAH